MQRYILFRFLQALVAMWFVTLVVFLLVRASGDPIEFMTAYEAGPEYIAQVRKHLGLDQSLPVQYWKFLTNALQGDFGQSIKQESPAMGVVLSRLWPTMQLALVAFAISAGIGIPLGVLSAMRRGRSFDRFGKLFALLGQSMPTFWVGLMLMLLFAVTLGWLPTSGMGSPQQFLMPAFTLGWFPMAALTRLSRSAVLDVLDQGYITMARVKGLPERMVIGKHAMRNAAVPIMTMASLQIIAFFSGSLIVEVIFSWPGLGKLLVDYILARDYPVVQAAVVVFCGIVIVVNMVVDILYAYLDPRIRYR